MHLNNSGFRFFVNKDFFKLWRKKNAPADTVINGFRRTQMLCFQTEFRASEGTAAPAFGRSGRPPNECVLASIPAANSPVAEDAELLISL